MRPAAGAPVLSADVLPTRPAESLLIDARRELLAAEDVDVRGPQDVVRAGRRYACAHLAALRAASAVLAARARPGPGRSRPVSVWSLLATVAPELGEWAGFFAAGTRKRAAAAAGVAHAVTVREADDLLRDARTFLDLVEELLGPPG
jgi:hypothetical protein